MKYLMIALIMLSADTCSDSKSNSKNNSNTLVEESKNKELNLDYRINDIWALETMLGKDAKSFFSTEVPNLEINLKDNKVSGFGGCNNYFSAITSIENNYFLLESIAATKKYCMDIPENAYLKLLQEANNYKLDGLTLILQKDEQELLRFKKVD